MGILRKLLTAPVSAPLGGAFWVVGKVTEAAEAEFRDPVRIRRALEDLEAELEAGRIDEDAYEDAEAILLDRLQGKTDGV